MTDLTKRCVMSLLGATLALWLGCATYQIAMDLICWPLGLPTRVS